MRLERSPRGPVSAEQLRKFYKVSALKKKKKKAQIPFSNPNLTKRPPEHGSLKTNSRISKSAHLHQNKALEIYSRS